MCMLTTWGKSDEEIYERVERDMDKTLAEMIEEYDVKEISNLEFDYFDAPLNVTFLACRGYAIIARRRYTHINGKFTLVAEYALYKAGPAKDFPEEPMPEGPLNDLSYAVTYRLTGICGKTFPSIPHAIADAVKVIDAMYNDRPEGGEC